MERKFEEILCPPRLSLFVSSECRCVFLLSTLVCSSVLSSRAVCLLSSRPPPPPRSCGSSNGVQIVLCSHPSQQPDEKVSRDQVCAADADGKTCPLSLWLHILRGVSSTSTSEVSMQAEHIRTDLDRRSIALLKKTQSPTPISAVLASSSLHGPD